MKKFYKLVSTCKEGDVYHIHLDGRAVKCPSGKELSVPSEALANEIVKEWALQDSDILPDTMPLTQMMTTCIDRVGTERVAMEGPLLKYLDTDLLCYRCGDEPVGQREAQEKSWNPWLEWFAQNFGYNLRTTTSIAALSQDEKLHAKVAEYVRGMSNERFTAFQLVVASSGSIVLGLAFEAGAISPQQIFDAAHVEESFKGEIYNEEKYGLAPHEETKRAAMLRDLEASASFLELL